jgi:endonuclease YncB( thermonuclease family)
MRKFARYVQFIGFAALFSLIACSKNSDNPTTVYVNTPDPLIDSAAQVTVGRVIDGDTFVIGIKNDSFSVRILGIDAFEIKHDARLDSQAVKANISVDSAYSLGQAGKRFADSLLSKKTVLLVRDNSQPDFDMYNRLLRHVYYYDSGAAHDYGALMIGKRLALVDTL